MRRPLRSAAAVLSALALAAVALAVPRAATATSLLDDAFYSYSGTTKLADIKPGTVLKTRTVPYHIVGLALPIQTTQLLYRSTSQIGKPTVNVTTVVRPLLPNGKPKLVAYQSFYDSLNPEDQPSVAIAGGVGLGDAIAYVETLLFAPLLLAGYTITIPDTEGQNADFAAGPEYGMNTLDGIRATYNSKKLALPKATKVGLMGYSGGAIATEWAAELAPRYAPEIATKMVGSAAGGVLVSPGHNLHYIDGSTVWSGVLPMALVGLSRAFHIDLTPYANAYGKDLLKKTQKQSIATALGAHPGLTWAKLTKPQYSTPESVPAFIKIANKLIMSTGGTPTTPLFLGQGTGGNTEGTSGTKPGIGKGDGVMIAGDVRTLARTYCNRGVKVKYQQYAGLSHVAAATAWLPQAYTWLLDRFAGKAAPSSCGSIPVGNSLAPLKAK
ncbi:MAG: secretory lipase family protein [Marmoricola sp.]|nr:secretory lipase family protein [Marmoricola sp.]